MLSDLWKYNIGSRTWTLVSGSTLSNKNGAYGSLGIPAAGNFPGARQNAVLWVDASGKIWLFGGFGFDSAGTGASSARPSMTSGYSLVANGRGFQETALPTRTARMALRPCQPERTFPAHGGAPRDGPMLPAISGSLAAGDTALLPPIRKDI